MFQSSSPTKIQAIAVTFNLVPTEGLPTPFKKLCKIYVFIWMLLSFFFSYIVNHFSIRLNQVHSPWRWRQNVHSERRNKHTAWYESPEYHHCNITHSHEKTIVL